MSTDSDEATLHSPRHEPAGGTPSLQIPSRAAAASTGVPGLGTHTAVPVPAPSFTVDRQPGPRGLVGAADGPRAPLKTSSASERPAPRRRRRGRPRDRFRPRHDRRSSRTHRGPLGISDDPGIGSKIKKKPPSAIILGNDLGRPSQSTNGPRRRPRAPRFPRSSSPGRIAVPSATMSRPAGVFHLLPTDSSHAPKNLFCCRSSARPSASIYWRLWTLYVSALRSYSPFLTANNPNSFYNFFFMSSSEEMVSIH